MLDSTHRHAETLVEVLVDHGPLTSAECCVRLGWSKNRFGNALKYARDVLCPALDLTIPVPTPDDGWLYRVTQDWEWIEHGASYAVGLIETRLRGVARDVKTVLPMLERGTVEWRRANFLAKHLTNITGTLGEINDGPREARASAAKRRAESAEEQLDRLLPKLIDAERTAKRYRLEAEAAPTCVVRSPSYAIRSAFLCQSMRRRYRI